MIYCKQNFSTSTTSDKFKASSGWFDKFVKRSDINSVIRHVEASSFDMTTAEVHKKEFMEFTKAEYTKRKLKCWSEGEPATSTPFLDPSYI